MLISVTYLECYLKNFKGEEQVSNLSVSHRHKDRKVRDRLQITLLR